MGLPLKLKLNQFAFQNAVVTLNKFIAKLQNEDVGVESFFWSDVIVLEVGGTKSLFLLISLET